MERQKVWRTEAFPNGWRRRYGGWASGTRAPSARASLSSCWLQRSLSHLRDQGSRDATSRTPFGGGVGERRHRERERERQRKARGGACEKMMETNPVCVRARERERNVFCWLGAQSRRLVNYSVLMKETDLTSFTFSSLYRPHVCTQKNPHKQTHAHTRVSNKLGCLR